MPFHKPVIAKVKTRIRRPAAKPGPLKKALSERDELYNKAVKPRRKP